MVNTFFKDTVSLNCPPASTSPIRHQLVIGSNLEVAIVSANYFYNYLPKNSLKKSEKSFMTNACRPASTTRLLSQQSGRKKKNRFYEQHCLLGRHSLKSCRSKKILKRITFQPTFQIKLNYFTIVRHNESYILSFKKTTFYHK